MKKYVILTTFSFIFSFIYLSFIYVILGFLTPNFLIIIPIAFMYKNKNESSYFLAFALGLFADLFVGHYIGITSILLVLLVEVFHQLKSRVGYVNVVTVATVFTGSFIYDQFLQHILYDAEFLLSQSLWQALISSFFVFIAIKALNMLPEGYWPKNSNVD